MVIIPYIVFGISLVAGDTICPDDFIAYKGSCYYFAYGTVKTFTEAEHFCNQHHGHLVQVDNVHENNFLLDFVNNLKPHSWWIGLTDDLVEGEWRWAGSDDTPVFTYWGHGQPWAPNGTDADCVIMHSSEQFKWNDDKCSSLRNPLCEIQSEDDGGSIIG